MTVAMILWRVSTWAPKVYAEDVMPFAQLLQSLRQKDRVLKALKRSIMYTDFSGKSIVFIGFFLITYLFYLLITYSGSFDSLLGERRNDSQALESVSIERHIERYGMPSRHMDTGARYARQS